MTANDNPSSARVDPNRFDTGDLNARVHATDARQHGTHGRHATEPSSLSLPRATAAARIPHTSHADAPHTRRHDRRGLSWVHERVNAARRIAAAPHAPAAAGARLVLAAVTESSVRAIMHSSPLSKAARRQPGTQPRSPLLHGTLPNIGCSSRAPGGQACYCLCGITCRWRIEWGCQRGTGSLSGRHLASPSRGRRAARHCHRPVPARGQAGRPRSVRIAASGTRDTRTLGHARRVARLRTDGGERARRRHDPEHRLRPWLAQPVRAAARRVALMPR